MKGLAHELAALVATSTRCVTARVACEALAAEIQHVRAAMRELNEAGVADLVRDKGSRELFLVQVGERSHGRVNMCVVCRGEFERRLKSKARTCSRSCSNSLGWSDPEKVQKRIANIRAEKATPEAKARQTEHNRKRWSRPGERERLSRQNRQRWADPATRANMSRGIRSVQQSPEMRQHYSEMRKRDWADPEKRKKLVDGIRRSKGSPEARALFSKLLKARWQDPEWRKKYLSSSAVKARQAGKSRKRKEQEARL
jgi:hypothetical protein